MRLIFIFFLLLLAACTSSNANYERKINVLKGATVADLLVAWGPPLSFEAIEDDIKILKYVKTSNYNADNASGSYQAGLTRCSTTFTFNKGILEKVNYAGQNCK